MSSCCEDSKAKKKGEKVPEMKLEEEPKSVVGKYLYNLGKKEAGKEAKKPHEGRC